MQYLIRAMMVVANMNAMFLYWITSTAAVGACSFPAHWQDSWITNAYGSNINLKVEISENTVTRRGRCIESSGTNKYLLQKTVTEDNVIKHCYTCMIFTVRHTNLVQFKEKTQCNPVNTDQLLNGICGQIDANVDLQTLLKENAIPISCPEVLQRSLKFEYTNEFGDCESAESVVQKCASNTRLQFIFGRCPHHNRIEKEIQCLASWKIGSASHWLYVKYGSDDYRCMHYDASSSIMGISSDASCSSISDIYIAPTYVTWSEDVVTSKLQANCNYPSWFRQQEWTDLEAYNIYRYDLLTNELVVDKQISGVLRYTETSRRHTCHQKIIETAEEARYITKVIDGCSDGYQCVIMKRKSDSVIAIVTGELTASPGDACTPRRRNSARARSRLLIDSNTKAVSCPVTGIYSLQSEPSMCPPKIEMGCKDSSSIIIRECDVIQSDLLCLASWKEESTDTNHLVISKRSYPRSGNCYTYHLDDRQDFVIAIDEQCNYRAPKVVDSTYAHPPFRLPSAKKQCVEGNDNPAREHQTFDEDFNSPATYSSCNMLLIILTLVKTIII